MKITNNIKVPPLFQLWLFAILSIIISYFYLDRPIADFVYAHQLRSHLSMVKNIIEWPPMMVGIAPLMLILAWVCCKNHSLSKWHLLLVTMTLSTLLSYFLKNDLKWMFSRDWPETWTHQNLSWISNHAYGFQWFQGKIFTGNDTTGSFPSGHSTLAFAALTPIGLYYRRLLMLCLGLASLEALAMIVFDYHFLSDVIAGAALGITCADVCYQLIARA